MKVLKFGKGNAKLGKEIFTFSLPAGYTCPGADKCLSYAGKVNGKIKDGANTEFRCFSASQESLFPSVRKARWHNLNLLKRAGERHAMAKLIEASLPKHAKYVRVHVSGDFFNKEYLYAWLFVALDRPDTTFYFYTKMIPLWLEAINLIGNGHKHGLIANVVPTASYGGKWDHLIEQHGLRFAKVVYSKKEAKEGRLKLDHDDSFAMNFGQSFGLLLHGTQPRNSVAAKALSTLKMDGETGYSRRKSLTVLSS